LGNLEQDPNQLILSEINQRNLKLGKFRSRALDLEERRGVTEKGFEK